MEHDEQVQAKGSMLDVEEVVLQLLFGVFQRVAILVTDLSPTSDSWTYNIAHRVVRNLFGEPLDEFGAPAAGRQTPCHPSARTRAAEFHPAANCAGTAQRA